MKEPNWTAEQMNAKKGDTTFKTCGNCDYAGCGSYRYGTMLSGVCDLMEPYSDDLTFDTECKIIKFSKEDIRRLIENKQYEIRQSKESITRSVSEIKVLKSLTPKNKPPLPSNRGQCFEINEIVYVFYKGKWNRGIVVNGYRHKDGCVSYVLDDYPESKGGWGCGTAVPCVIKEWEYNYFSENNEDYLIWLDESNKKYNGDFLDIQKYKDNPPKRTFRRVK